MASMDLTDSMDLSLSKLQEIVKDRKTRQAAVHGVEKYWSFSISPSTEYSGLISFKIDWFDLLAVQGILKSLLQHQPQFKNYGSSVLSLLYGPALTSAHDYQKNHGLD